MKDLLKRNCVPCHSGVTQLLGEELTELLRKLSDGWSIIDEHHLEKDFFFTDFKEAMAFATEIGKMSEREKHHPEIIISWGKVVLTVWTHKINGLFISDFIWAAKADQIFIRNFKLSGS